VGGVLGARQVGKWRFCSEKIMIRNKTLRSTYGASQSASPGLLLHSVEAFFTLRLRRWSSFASDLSKGGRGGYLRQ